MTNISWHQPWIGNGTKTWRKSRTESPSPSSCREVCEFDHSPSAFSDLALHPWSRTQVSLKQLFADHTSGTCSEASAGSEQFSQSPRNSPDHCFQLELLPNWIIDLLIRILSDNRLCVSPCCQWLPLHFCLHSGPGNHISGSDPAAAIRDDLYRGSSSNWKNLAALQSESLRILKFDIFISHFASYDLVR